MVLVRIQRQIVHKRYYQKSSYEYVALRLYIPKRFHKIFEPYLAKDLDMTVRNRNGEIHITLAPKGC